MQTEIVELQNRIVSALARSIKESWDYVLVSFEREIVEEESVQDCLFVYFVRQGGQMIRNSIVTPRAIVELLEQLALKMTNNDENQWSSCILEIDKTGKYRYSFSYDPPKRLNGVFDDAALFKNYAPCPL